MKKINTKKSVCDYLESLKSFMSMYKNDINIDKDSASVYAGIPFIHILRDTGTHVYFLHGLDYYPKKWEKVRYLFSECDRVHIVKNDCSGIIYASKMQTTDKKNEFRFYDGRSWFYITSEELVAIVTTHEKTLLNKFNKAV